MAHIPARPGYYVSRGRHENALDAMQRLRGPTYPEEEIHAELNEIKAFVEIEMELEGARWIDLFRGTDLRRTCLTVFSTMGQEFSGIAFVSG